MKISNDIIKFNSLDIELDLSRESLDVRSES